MSSPPERPWTEEEKYALLTEILKKAGVPSSYLFKMINDLRISPSWTEIPLPPGRSLNSCQTAYSIMFQESSPMQTPFGLAPQAISTVRAPTLDANTTKKRPLQPLDRTAFAGQRAIRPRLLGPSGTEGSVQTQLTPGLEPISGGEKPPKPRRGRPTKAESARRQAEAQAQGKEYSSSGRQGATRRGNKPMPSAVGSTTSEGWVISPRPLVDNPETRATEAASGESSGAAGTSTQAWRERPIEDTAQDQTELTSPQGEMRPQAETERTLPSIQSMQLVFGGDTPRTIPGTAGVRPLGAPPFSYPGSNRAFPSVTGTSNPGHQQGPSLEVLAGTGGNQETTRREGGPSESGT
ncbi:hypothetical protein DTO027B5_5668 [Paecilomyces variotii]|nr:hypothetical protein DTO021C3_5384 [Paecilomyces variotii]KAJ9306686.1 hypothetical protein DTO217A2_3854 [Paecilomyces variotii]KAJ9325519.1 hypothetical protein DTO027B3_3455 [Paecilomyces variotii]KAJ9332535.1 hypothetical protein DTO027B5_5668 [Paecilomyces variotii]KAJ9384813.1 hypothetical protein DTO063F5_4511 [Paecilomyces variotii]